MSRDISRRDPAQVRSYWGPFLILGIVLTIFGIFCVVKATANNLSMLVAAFFVVGGFFRTIQAIVIPFPKAAWIVVSGLVWIALGIYMTSIWMTATTVLLGKVIAIALLVDGACVTGLAVSLHSLTDQATKGRAA
jgi:uncharacterized membrane protein HdeD (DUF308 family)